MKMKPIAHITSALKAVACHAGLKIKNRFAIVSALVLIIAGSAQAADGTWTNNAAGNWSGTGNWLNGVLADGADFTATFGNYITADRIITLDAAITIGNITASDASNNYTISGANILTLDRTDATAPQIDVTTSGRTLTISSQISGNDGLQKISAGTLVLLRDNTTANTYTGTTTLSAGTLQGNTGASVSLTPGNPFGTSALQLNGGTLQLRSSGTANSTADTIQFNNTITVGGNVTINVDRAGGSGSNKILQLGTLSIGAFTLIAEDASSAQHDLKFGATTLTGNAVFDVRNNGGGTTFMNLTLGAIGDGGLGYSLTKSGAGTLTLGAGNNNTFSGGFNINGGVVSVDSTTHVNAFGASSNVITFTGNATIHNINNTYTIGQAVAVNNGVTATFRGANAENTIVNGIVSGSGTIVISSDSNTMSASLANTANTHTGTLWVGGTGGNGLNFTANSLADSSTGTLKVGSSGGAINFTLGASTSAPVTLTNRAVELAGTTGAISLNNDASSAANIFTIHPNLTFTTASSGNKTLTLGGANTGANAFNGSIGNNGTSTTAITKAGGGKWILSGANTYSGATTISAGTLQIGNGGTTGSVSTNSAISNAATLAFNRSNTIVQGTDFTNTISGAGVLNQNGAGTLALGGTNTYTGATTVNAGTLRLDSLTAIANSPLNTAGAGVVSLNAGAGSYTFGGLTGSANLATVITGSPSSLTALVLNPGTGLTPSYSGIIGNLTAGMSVTKSGVGTQTLSGNNSFSGGLTVSAGTLLLSGTQSFTGGVTLNGGSMGNGTTGNGITAAALNNNAVTATSGTSYFFIAPNETLSTTSTITINSTLDIGVANGGTVTVPGVVSGTGTLILSGNNLNAGQTIKLTNIANTFSGNVSFPYSNGGVGNGPTLSVVSIGDAGKVTVGSTTGDLRQFALDASAIADLTFNTRQFELVGAVGNASPTIANNSTKAFNINTDLLNNATAGTRTITLRGTGNGLSTFAGNITKGSLTTLAITKTESGTWVLSGANDYNGVTTVSGGILAFIGNANVASPNPLGQSSTAAANLLLANGTTLRYVGAAASTDRNFTLSVISNNHGASLDASGTGAINFTSTASPAYGTINQPRTLTLTGINTGNNTLAANLADNGTATMAVSIAKTGIGTWVLTGQNANTGNTTISGGGKLILDYGVAASAQDSSKIAGVLTLNNGGGDITLRGGSHVETVGSLAMTTLGGHTSITREVGSGATIALGAIARSANGGVTLSLAADNLATTSSAVVNGILGGWTTVGSNWAKVSSGNIVALASGDYTTLTSAAVTTTVNYQLTGSLSRDAALLNSLRIVGDGDDQTLTITSGDLRPSPTQGTGGILYAGGGNNNYTITGAGNIQAQQGNQEVIINTYTGTLTVDMALTMGLQGLTKTGAGTVILTKAGTYSGATYVNQGILRLANAAGAGTTGGIFVQNGAALELSGGINIGAKAITVTGTGVASGGALRNVSGINTYDGAITVGTGGTLINSAGGRLTLGGAIGTSLNNDLTFDGAGDVTVTNVISGVGSVIKNGTGTLTLTTNNTYSGVTLINAGTLAGVVGGSCSNSAITVASAGALGVNVADSSKKWTCASLALNSGSQLKFNFTGTPSASTAPLNILGSLSFSGTPTIVVSPSNITPGTYPLLTVGGVAPVSAVPSLSGVNGTLAWTGNTLWLTIMPPPTFISFF